MSQRRKTCHSHGFTLIELLVVIVIMVILISMLLPAISSMRESARRIECQSRLSQLSLALHNYETLHQSLPAGVIDPQQRPIQNQAVGFHHGWIGSVLPFLDQQLIWRNIDFKQSVYSPANAPARKMKIRSLECPSEYKHAGATEGMSSYAGCHHDVEAPIDIDNRGVLFLNSHLQLKEVEDGVGNTIFLGEKLYEPGDLGWLSGTRATLRNTGIVPTGLPPFTGSSEPAESETVTPSEVKPAGDPLLRVGGFASNHSGGGMNVALGDSSVRFLSSSIAPNVFQQLGDRRDGKLMSSDF